MITKKLIMIMGVIWLAHVIALFWMHNRPDVYTELATLRDRQDWMLQLLEKIVQEKEGKHVK